MATRSIRACDYARLVRTYVLDPPAAYGGIGACSLTALARTLTGLQLHDAPPPSRNRCAAALKPAAPACRRSGHRGFFAMLDAPVRDYIARASTRRRHIPSTGEDAPSHRLAGSWSVMLSPGGYHVDHVHPQGR